MDTDTAIHVCRQFRAPNAWTSVHRSGSLAKLATYMVFDALFPGISYTYYDLPNAIRNRTCRRPRFLPVLSRYAAPDARYG
jgi:hypothetical protein